MDIIMNSPVLHLFVYGSLRQGFNNPFFEFVRNHFKYTGTATVKGALYDLKDYPAGVPSDIHTILGELYLANSEADFDWAITQLDDYEGLHPEEGENSLYRREVVKVYCAGAEKDAWIYWYNGDVSNEPIIPSGDVMDYVRSRMSSGSSPEN